MKNIFFVVIFALSVMALKAQGVAINNNAAPADASALLDISSHEKGILIPRLRTIERTAIAGPVQGLLAYDIDTHSFWYFDNGSWKEIFNSGNPVTPGGIAGGNLSGNYPNPTVAKIQNLNVSSNFPFDKQVLKWDAINNEWSGLNDSLFLPYNVTFSNPSVLFGITNSSLAGGGTAIYGKRTNGGSGMSIANSTGVWGDDATGAGVTGTGNTGLGVYGLSVQNHGINGWTTAPGFAGVYGNNSALNAYGVMGEVSGKGIAVYGKSTGTLGKAAWFQNTNVNNTDTTLKVSTAGIGRLSTFNITNSSNTSPAIDIYHEGNGKGVQVYLNNNSGTSNAVDAVTNGNGVAVYGKSETGIAGKFEITNNSSPGTALYVATAGLQPASQFIINNSNSFNALLNGSSNGKGAGISLNMSNTSNNSGILELSGSGTGKGIDLSLSNVANSSNALYVNTEGTGPAGYFNANNPANSQAALKIKHLGTGRGIESIISNSSSNAAAIYGSSSGANAIQGFAQVVGVHGQTTGLTGGIGVEGWASLNSSNGIGVKGISYSNVTTSGSVTGENIGDGVGVYGSSTTTNGNGIGVKGMAGSTLNTGIGVLGEGGINSNFSTIGVKGTSYNVNHAVGSVTGINFSSGVGVYGEAQDLDGVGVLGLVGSTNQNSKAGQFKNVYSGNTFSVMEIVSNGLGSSIFSDNTNLSNSQPIFRVKNAGTGDFLKFETNLGTTITTVQKDGDFITAGAVTVRNNKGIVRNSTATQVQSVLMTATIPAGGVSHYDAGGFNSQITVNITFTSSFSQVPYVFIGNVLSGGINGLTATIENVTTTGCTLWLRNWTQSDFTIPTTTLRILAMGAE